MTGWPLALAACAVCILLGRMTSMAGQRNGRLLTWPVRRRFPHLNVIEGHPCRLLQILALIVVWWPVPMPFCDYGYWSCVVGLYLDDYLSDDGRGRRWLRKARNRIKWRMTLPAPAKPTTA